MLTAHVSQVVESSLCRSTTEAGVFLQWWKRQEVCDGNRRAVSDWGKGPGVRVSVLWCRSVWQSQVVEASLSLSLALSKSFVVDGGVFRCASGHAVKC